MFALLVGLLIAMMLLIFWEDLIKIIKLILMLIFGIIVVTLSWLFLKRGK
jgi:hypothetical protein